MCYKGWWIGFLHMFSFLEFFRNHQSFVFQVIFVTKLQVDIHMTFIEKWLDDWHFIKQKGVWMTGISQMERWLDKEHTIFINITDIVKFNLNHNEEMLFHNNMPANSVHKRHGSRRIYTESPAESPWWQDSIPGERSDPPQRDPWRSWTT